MVVVGCEEVIAPNVKLNASNVDKFLECIQTKVIPYLDIQWFILLDNVPFHKSCEVQEAFEEVGHICFHLLSYNPFLNVAKRVFAHIKSQVLWNDLQDHGTLLSHISHGA